MVGGRLGLADPRHLLAVGIDRRRRIPGNHILPGRFDARRARIDLIADVQRMGVVHWDADLVLAARRARRSPPSRPYRIRVWPTGTPARRQRDIINCEPAFPQAADNSPSIARRDTVIFVKGFG